MSYTNDTRLYNLTWIPVARQFYWEIRITDILVDGKPMGMCDGDLAAPTGDGCKVREGSGWNRWNSSIPSLPLSLPLSLLLSLPLSLAPSLAPE